mmetsp:Transcript_124549/g.295558  ORF Transcript_124549/g.295558 Transcript_124549/m.295558 type:complete len:261 (-) Transcript_124549:49-831(-)
MAAWLSSCSAAKMRSMNTAFCFSSRLPSRTCCSCAASAGFLASVLTSGSCQTSEMCKGRASGMCNGRTSGMCKGFVEAWRIPKAQHMASAASIRPARGHPGILALTGALASGSRPDVSSPGRSGGPSSGTPDEAATLDLAAWNAEEWPSWPSNCEIRSSLSCKLRRRSLLACFSLFSLSCVLACTACFSKRSVCKIAAASSNERPAICSLFSSGRWARYASMARCRATKGISVAEGSSCPVMGEVIRCPSCRRSRNHLSM